jgi:hypothetical protein
VTPPILLWTQSHWYSGTAGACFDIPAATAAAKGFRQLFVFSPAYILVCIFVKGAKIKREMLEIIEPCLNLEG